MPPASSGLEMSQSGPGDIEDFIVRRHDVVRADARLRDHIPSGPRPITYKSDAGPIRVWVSQRGSVIAEPLRGVLEHGGYHWEAVMEFTYYGPSYVGPLKVVKFPDSPQCAHAVSRDNIVRALRKAASTFMLQQEAAILPLALKDIERRKSEEELALAQARADLAQLPAEGDGVVARRFDLWFGTVWVSPSEGELSVVGGGFSGSITVSGKICRLEAVLPLARGHEPAITLVNIFASEKTEEVPPMLRAALLELAEVVRTNHPDLTAASQTIRARRRLQIDIAGHEQRLIKLERFGMMYQDRLEPVVDLQARPMRPMPGAA